MTTSHPPLEARGTNGTVTWDGRTLTVWMRINGAETVIPGRQVASITLRPSAFRFEVTTVDGRRFRVGYWFGRTPQFRAVRDAVMDAIAAMG